MYIHMGNIMSNYNLHGYPLMQHGHIITNKSIRVEAQLSCH